MFLHLQSHLQPPNMTGTFIFSAAVSALYAKERSDSDKELISELCVQKVLSGNTSGAYR